MRRVLLVLLSALLLSVLPGVPAQAAVPEGATFNVPRPWGSKAQKYRNINKVIKAIEQVPAATERRQPVILISSYLFDHRPSAEALVGACKKGISVRVVLDGDIDNKTSRYLISALNGDNGRTPESGNCGRGEPTAATAAGEAPFTDREVAAAEDESIEELDAPLLSAEQAEQSALAVSDARPGWGGDESYVTRCRASCRGRGGNMHTKFYAFSRTGGADDVVMVSSSNLNRAGGALGWNDMYTMVGVGRTFEFYKKIHLQMTDDQDINTRRAAENRVAEGPYLSRFFPLDGARKAQDPTLQDLNKIRCRSAFGRTRINISMFFWAGSRGEYLATKLLNLASAGCRVSIIYGAPSIKIAARLRAAAKARRINLYDSRWDFNNDGYNEIRTHSKYVLVKGTFAGDRSARLVMTGSQNWVAGSLSRGDESTLNIAKASAYNDYLANWNKIRTHSRRLPYNR